MTIFFISRLMQQIIISYMKIRSNIILYLYKALNIFCDLIHHTEPVFIFTVGFLEKVEIDQKNSS